MQQCCNLWESVSVGRISAKISDESAMRGFIAAVKGLQGDDILVSMGWSLGAATTLPTAVNLFYHGNMLLCSGVGGILLKQFETAEALCLSEPTLLLYCHTQGTCILHFSLP